jgi:hypothetical protein
MPLPGNARVIHGMTSQKRPVASELQNESVSSLGVLSRTTYWESQGSRARRSKHRNIRSKREVLRFITSLEVAKALELDVSSLRK